MRKLGAIQPAGTWSLRFLLKAYATQHTGSRGPALSLTRRPHPSRLVSHRLHTQYRSTLSIDEGYLSLEIRPPCTWPWYWS